MTCCPVAMYKVQASTLPRASITWQTRCCASQAHMQGDMQSLSCLHKISLQGLLKSLYHLAKKML